MRVSFRGGKPYVDFSYRGQRVRERAEGCLSEAEAKAYMAHRFLEVKRQHQASGRTGPLALGEAAMAYGLSNPSPPGSLG